MKRHVLSPDSGATLVTTDRESVDLDAPTLEAGRQSLGGWSFHREDAYAEILRLRSTLADHLTTLAASMLDDILCQVVATPTTREAQPDAAIRHLAQQVDNAGRRAARYSGSATRTPRRTSPNGTVSPACATRATSTGGPGRSDGNGDSGHAPARGGRSG